MSDATLWSLISFVCACPISASRSRMTPGREGFSAGRSRFGQLDLARSGCLLKLDVSKALTLRFLPHGMDRKAREIRQVRRPWAHKEFSSLGWETTLGPFVGTGFIVAIANA